MVGLSPYGEGPRCLWDELNRARGLGLSSFWALAPQLADEFLKYLTPGSGAPLAVACPIDDDAIAVDGYLGRLDDDAVVGQHPRRRRSHRPGVALSLLIGRQLLGPLRGVRPNGQEDDAALILGVDVFQRP